MEKAFKYRIYPNKTQRELIHKTFGCTRFVYNYFLHMRITEYKSNFVSVSYKICSSELTRLKQDEDYLWLNEVDSTALQTALKNLDKSYQSFFKKISGFPKFKSKKSKQSYISKNVNNSIQVIQNKIKLPKLGYIRTKVSRQIEGRILSATISKESNGKYYVSVCCTVEDIPAFPKTGKNVGIDLGIKHFATFSDNTVIDNIRIFDTYLNKLRLEQRSLSRKTSGSNSYLKQKLKVSKLHEKIRHIREDFLQKLSTKVIKDYDVICVEDLKVKNMLKNHKLARHILDVAWAKFLNMLEYKANWYQKKYIQINTYIPSSQLCHICGYKNTAVKDLSMREWKCPECGTVHDRDLNASINILNFGLSAA